MRRFAEFGFRIFGKGWNMKTKITSSRNLLASLLLCAASFSAHAELTFVSFGGALQSAQKEAFIAPFVKATSGKVTDKDWDGGIGKLTVRSRLGTGDWDIVQVEG